MFELGRFLNPRDERARDDRFGWKYEGFYLEARDQYGVPAFVIFDFMRGGDGGGGQWARSESLYPYAHS